MTDESTAVTLARIEGKLDLLHAALASIQAQGADHEIRLRALESTALDHERIRALEARPVIDPKRVKALEDRPVGITPARLLASLVSFGSLAAALSAVVTLLTR